MTICDTRANCGLCRHRSKGAAFRRALVGAREVSAAGVDFDCPHGVPWGSPDGWSPDMPARGAGDVVAKIAHAIGITPCGGCLGRQAALNAMMPRKPT